MQVPKVVISSEKNLKSQRQPGLPSEMGSVMPLPFDTPARPDIF
jgi:hypothetical protein